MLVTFPTGMPSTATGLPSYSPTVSSNCAVTVIGPSLARGIKVNAAVAITATTTSAVTLSVRVRLIAGALRDLAQAIRAIGPQRVCSW